MTDSTDTHDDHDHEHGHTTVFGYIMVFLGLMVGTTLTVLAATIDFHGFDFLIAMLIAVTKASLVLYFFMHLREAPLIIKCCGMMGFLFLGVLLMFFITDVKGQRAESNWLEAWPDDGELLREEMGHTRKFHEVYHYHHDHGDHGDGHGKKEKH